jgi:hypothetical protein
MLYMECLCAGSDDIVDYVEDKVPEPHLGKHDAPPHVYAPVRCLRRACHFLDNAHCCTLNAACMVFYKSEQSQRACMYACVQRACLRVACTADNGGS